MQIISRAINIWNAQAVLLPTAILRINCKPVIIWKTSVYIQCDIEIIRYRKNAELTKEVIAQ